MRNSQIGCSLRRLSPNPIELGLWSEPSSALNVIKFKPSSPKPELRPKPNEMSELLVFVSPTSLEFVSNPRSKPHEPEPYATLSK